MEIKTTNPLLVKDEIGRQKISTRKLPDRDHFFGKPNRPDPEGVGRCKYVKIYSNFFSNVVLESTQGGLANYH